MATENKGATKYSAIGSVIFMWVIFAAVAALTYALHDWFAFAEVSMLGGEFNIVILILGGLYYAFCSYLYAFITESDAIFGEYNPIGKTINEVKSYIKRCYVEAEVPQGARKAVTVSIVMHGLLVLLAALLWTPFFFNYLLPLPLLCFGYLAPKKEYKVEDDFLNDFIVARTKKKQWKVLVCPPCGGIMTGKWTGNGNKSEYTTTGVDHYTTEREYTAGDTTIHETTFHSDPYVSTHYSYDSFYQCTRCKKQYKRHFSGQDKRHI